MADRYLSFSGTAPGRFLTRRPDLPQPAELHRWSPERPLPKGASVHLTAGESVLGLSPALARTGLGPGRMNSLPRGGLTTGRLAHPDSGAVGGEVVRVCGQDLLGA